MTIERPDPVAVIADMSVDALAEIACEVKEEAYRQLRMAELADREIRRRMVTDDATLLETDHWSGRLRPGAPYHIVQVPARLRKRLLMFLPAGDVDLAVSRQAPSPPGLKVNHQKLADLYRRGGSIAEIIDDERKSYRGEPKLELARKREVEIEQG